MSAYKKYVAVIAVFSALSFGVAKAATLFLTSDAQQAAVGGTVSMDVRIQSDQSVNATQGTLYYPKDIFDVEQVTRANSIFDIWLAEPSVNTSTGEISFLGGSTNAFSGSSMLVFTVTFRARGTGTGSVGFRNAAVTAGDGTGANILSSSTVLSFTVAAPGAASTQAIAPQAPLPPKQITRPATPTAHVPVVPLISVSLYPSQDAWYNTIGNFLAQWKLPTDVTGVATALNQNPQFDPAVSEGLFDNKTLGAVKEGVWYLHVRFKNPVGWGPTAHYRIAIDATPPFSFAAKEKEGSALGVSAPTLQFSTQDQPSGVAFYRILADGNTVGSTTATSFTLPSLSFGSHDIVVQAVDRAGNTTESRISVTVAPPPFLTVAGVKITEGIFFGIIIAVIIIGILIGWWLGRKAKMQRKNRIVIAGRDVTTAFGVIQKNIEKLLGYYNGGPMGESQVEEMKFLLKETKEETDKMKHYVSENVEEIEQ
jgi:hypothetical protein